MELRPIEQSVTIIAIQYQVPQHRMARKETGIIAGIFRLVTNSGHFNISPDYFYRNGDNNCSVISFEQAALSMIKSKNKNSR